ncbi:hypothetical protein S513_24880 [Salmonella enterica subsp. enterica serovar Newport]|nr:hypothetical protein [Salmonella enterica subsp. enterica serovar Give]EAP4203271.1 hypothetical protein [Salmonella enterica subsp. enterica serovar Poona]EAU5127747.1 hypothetical protein [Salmonella enterica subsp. enterica serovar Infantis]EBH8584253.1 hypothetical protein [Salmonella enterica subsp. enterica serovar Pomona]EDT7035545.1 hypothetical protein [Salmonella enterica subsp. enterica serovar Soahanina]EED3952255.1 hypothetical protein [Salmonella enterica subsp. enterica serov
MAEDDDNRDENAEDEDDDKKAKKAKGRKAEDEEDEPDASEDDGDDEDDPDASEDDGDDEGADDGDDDKDAKAVKQGRRAERCRCARIFGSRYAADNPALAAALAFETGMSSAQAIKVMSTGGMPVWSSARPARISLDERMAGIKNIHLGRDEELASTASAKGHVSAMISLYNRVRGVK